ncbi:MAG TPA: M20 family metallopeptidase [Gemmataceae bacterium]|nr:M20 family metallopeptidase [Gemmataceae bacterium]
MTDHEPRCVLTYLREHRQDMVGLLQRLALAESPSDNPAAVAPLLAMLASELEQAGLSVRLFPGRVSAGTLFARPRRRTDTSPKRKRGNEPLQLLVGHCDTVWPVGTVRQMPVRVEGETLRGPGVFDMKGGLVQMLYALRAVKDLDLRPPAGSVVVINSDEEIGSPDSTPLIRRLARRAARAFILEPAYGQAGKLKTARKASGGFTITIKGRAAHAGVNPEEGASAILEMSYQVQRLFALNDAARGITVNVGTIDGGLRSNVVAPEVRAAVDVRVRTRQDAAEVEAAIRGLRPVNPETTIQIEGGIEQPPMEPLPRNQALWRLAHDLGRRLGLELDQAAVGGASDGNTTSQYTATLDGLGAVGDGAHAAHEQVLIPQLVERCALLVLLLLAPLSPSEEPP